MDIPVCIEISEENKAELANILDCPIEGLVDQLSRFGAASLREYVTMILGQKVFRRSSDILDYRLFLLIEEVLEGQIPDEQLVSNLFQTTSSESRSLIRSVMSKYQNQLRIAIERSIRKVLNSASRDEEEDHYIVVLNCINLVEQMNSTLAEIDGNLPPIVKKHGGISTYLIQPSSFTRLSERYLMAERI